MKSKYPTLKSPSPNCGGAVITSDMIAAFRDKLLSPEYQEQQRRAEREREREVSAMNTEMKRIYAELLGKLVSQLTDDDMHKLNEQCFQAWLKYKGVTEAEFWEWMA